MQIHFTKRENGPERLVCEAEIVFGEELPGLKLVGFCLWRSTEGELFATFPSRAFGAGCERRYFDYVRAVDESTEGVKALKARIVDAYRAASQE